MARERIEEAAGNDRRLQGVQVEVAVQNGVVLLYGSVRLYIQRMLFEQLAWHNQRVREVDNEIEVVPFVPVWDAEIERAITSLLSESRRFNDIRLNVTVEKGRVTIRGTFWEPGDVVFLKHRLAEIEGVAAIEMAIEFET
ncbi:MAG: BON domain-containing protein [Deltaproteobacteria bacterium]|nr:BON domain-containing protein [Deltaproteobacteria bacterium]